MVKRNCLPKKTDNDEVPQDGGKSENQDVFWKNFSNLKSGRNGNDNDEDPPADKFVNLERNLDFDNEKHQMT